MSHLVTIEEAQSRLPELIAGLGIGDEMVITQNNQPVARLVADHSQLVQPRVPGNCRGMITLGVDDDEHLQDFAEYMP
jgi:antitoxin (DNA-binding transcriptional repressor) of toxin-antitoxin stability system